MCSGIVLFFILSLPSLPFLPFPSPFPSSPFLYIMVLPAVIQDAQENKFTHLFIKMRGYHLYCSHQPSGIPDACYCSGENPKSDPSHTSLPFPPLPFPSLPLDTLVCVYLTMWCKKATHQTIWHIIKLNHQ